MQKFQLAHKEIQCVLISLAARDWAWFIGLNLKQKLFAVDFAHGMIFHVFVLEIHGCGSAGCWWSFAGL